MGDVYDMHKDIRFAHFVERTFERFDELGGEFTDESDGIAQKEGNILDDNFSDCGVERREEFVFGENVRLCQQVHQGAFAHVRISHEGQSDHLSAVTALSAHLPVDLGKLFLKAGDSLLYDTTVGLYLGFTHTAAGTPAAPLSFEVGPHAGKPWKHVVVLGQFYLHLGVGGLGPLGEDFQDKTGPVYYYTVLKESFDITLLHPGEFIIEDAVSDAVGFAVLSDFLYLSASDIGGSVGTVDLLDEGFVASDTGGFGQKSEFVEVFTNAVFVVILFNDSDEDRFLGEYFSLFQSAYLSWKITGKV